MSAKVQPADASSNGDAARNYVTVCDIGGATTTTTPSEKPNDALPTSKVPVAPVAAEGQDPEVETTEIVPLPAAAPAPAPRITSRDTLAFFWQRFAFVRGRAGQDWRVQR